MLATLLTPVAVLAGALGVWRLGADPGWTNQFFIATGLLSHWQPWFAVAACMHTSARSLNRWLEIRNSRAENAAVEETSNSSAAGNQTASLLSGQIEIAVLDS
jgi:hypothetical protein